MRRLVLCLALLSSFAHAQDRLPSMPGYKRYQEMSRQIASSVSRGELSVQWVEGGFTYQKEGKRIRYDLAKREERPFDPPAAKAPNPSPDPNRGRARPARGRQYVEAFSPDGKRRAFYRDGNLWLSDEGGPERALTTEGDLARRVKFGSGSWVYGEELGQNDAFGWSPDGERLWCYRFDEGPVKDYFLTLGQTEVQNRLYTEAYPKAGAANPEVELWIVDADSGQKRPVKIRPGAFDEGVGHYVYGIRWSVDGRELWFHRTNRWQNVMEWCGANPETGEVRVIVREEWPASWTENQPPRQFFDEMEGIDKAPGLRGKALWLSERTGFRNVMMLDLKTGRIEPVTRHPFEVERIVRVDLAERRVFYRAWDGDTPYKSQLHVIGLDGKGHRRITDPKYHHTVSIAPDGKWFVDVAEAIDRPPTTRLLDAQGTPVATLAESDTSRFEALGLRRVERLRFVAADGKTPLYGELNLPSNFDPSRKYPLLVSVYAGPDSAGMSERFQTPDALTEMGFLVASFAGRGTNNRGKAFKDALYLKLGGPEIDDQAAGVRHLAQRPYVDAARVGIHGVSYGGYAAAIALLRHPDVFHAACASSSVTDWRNYDTIYTERYMRTPQTNQAGYDGGSCMTYAANLRGRLMLFYGTADDNVHPANTHQLARALQRAGKGFELQVGADVGHAGLDFRRMMEFFVERLVTNP
jgi:dipeptidyl-peptidase-4